MRCEELQDLYELYALGVLDVEDCLELEAHLNRDCPTCMKEMRRAIDDNAVVLRSVPNVDPPDSLRSRILAGFGIDARPFWRRAAPWSLAVAMLLILLFIRLPSMWKPTVGSTVNARVVEFLKAPGTRQFSFGNDSLAAAPRGRVLMSDRKGALLLVSNLPIVPAGKKYEAWLVPKNGAPRPAGQLIASADGGYIGLIDGPLDAASIKAVAVSVEPASSAPVSPTQVLFAAATE
jgi:anti-sigma-K factor RskA